MQAAVVVIGGGPVGLATAVDLARRGVEVLVVERRPGARTNIAAKASALNERSLEICRWWGVRDQVVNLGVPDDVNLDTVYCSALDGRLIGVDPRPPMRDQVPPAGAVEVWRKVPQYLFDQVLAAKAADTPGCRLLYGHEGVGIEQSATSVRVQVRELATGEQREILADYVVAADGAGSRTRRLLGIPFEESVLTHSVSVMIRADLSGTQFGVRNRFMFIDDSGTWANLTAVDLKDLWRLTLVGSRDGIDATTYDPRPDLDRAIGKDIDYEILDVSFWRRSEGIAATFRAGRVLLAGDAAHTTSPTGGHGLNTGLGDALAAGWMLAAVVGGYADPRLLDAYDCERRPVAIRNGAVSTENFHHWISGADFHGVLEEGPAGDATRKKVAARLSENLRQEWISSGVALGYRYEHSPVICAEPGPEPSDPISEYIPCARPGHRAPNVRLDDGTPLVDRLGHGFVLLELAADPRESTRIRNAAQALDVPLTTIGIADAEARAIYEDSLVLIRPDGHVAWRGDRAPFDPGDIFRRVLALPAPAAPPPHTDASQQVTPALDGGA